MSKSRIIALVILILSAILTVISFVVLPDEVIVQFTTGGKPSNYMPKLQGILIPAILSIGGAVFSLILKEDNNGRKKSMFVAVMGVMLYGFLIFVNL